MERRRLEKILDRFDGLRLLVVGDVVLDEYLWGEVDRISPEAPVPVVHVKREAVVLGGAGNVVRNGVALGAQCDFCAVVGDDDEGREVRALVRDLGVDADGIAEIGDRPTTRKTRVVARGQQVVRFDRESDEAVPAAARERLRRAACERLAGADAVVFEDYGKGLFSGALTRPLLHQAGEAGIPVVVDPKGSLTPFKGASLLKPNLREAEALSGIAIRSDADLERAARRLQRRIGGGDVVVTRGGAGITVFEGEAPGRTAPSLEREVFDMQGAGDTTVAALALALAAGADLFEAALLANVAAGVVVGKTGTATASRDEIRALLPDALAAVRGRR
ncbi:MAG: bifunctional ADP-heptose synthase [Proteobacteria bacterium]|nr:bifunctional ADP-heptose synthase [Pseudomonadota bacterium]